MSGQSSRRLLTGACLIYPFWLGMMAVHELGHVIGAATTGGRVVHVSIPLLGFSRTDVSPNPSPRIVAWSGPIVGILLPVTAWFALARAPLRPLLQTFAGWCLVANGAYIGVGWIDRVGDAGELVRCGTSLPTMIAFGVASVSAGLCLWQSLGGRNP
jgi:hypothetical protein